jgi:hypothetical protein
MKFYVFQDYLIYAETECDPSIESCFVYECDSTLEECTGNPEEDIYYYKLITKKASYIPVCDPNEEECEVLTCQPGEEGCEETSCTSELADEQEVYCSAPEDFTQEEMGDEELEDEDAE